MRTFALLAALLLLATSARAETPQNRLLDVSADVLEPGEDQFSLLYAQYTRGIVPRLQLSAHLAPYLLTLANGCARFQLVRGPELRVSVEGGFWWFALSEIAQTRLFAIPADARATVGLGGPYEVTLAGTFQWLQFETGTQRTDARRVNAEATLVRHDAKGAFFLRARLPLFVNHGMRVASLLGEGDVTGSLTLDDLSSWSVLVARDHIFKQNVHLRFGLAYRNQPGILVIESMGNVLLTFDLYWRWGAD